ncbi:MAG: DNA-3-methyladenine glycosylase [Thermoanaerobaculia bacterium]
MAASLLRFDVPGDFAFEPTVRSHGWYLLEPFRWERASSTLHRVESLGRSVFELEIRVRAGSLEIAADRELGAAHQRELRVKLGRMLQLDLDIEEFARLSSDSETHRWVARTGFGRMLCGATRFEDAVKIIATTNTTWKQTMRMVELLVTELGARSRGGSPAFPSPSRIASATVDQLRERCRLGYRATTIHSLARSVAEGAVDLDAISDPTLDAPGQLLAWRTLPGIGPYGAAHMMALDGRHDFIAVDTEFRRFVRERYHRGRAVADATLLRRYSRWGRWKYLAYWAELWESAAESLVKYESSPE